MVYNLTKIQKSDQDFFLLFDYMENEAWLITPGDFSILEEIFRGVIRRYQYSFHFGETTMGVLDSMEDSPSTINEDF